MTFGALSAIAMIVVTTACVLLWNPWHLDRIASGMGVPNRPLACGLVLSMVPIYFAAMHVWLPLVPPLPRDLPATRKPLSEDEMHWRLVTVVYIVCILFTEIVVEYLPMHYSGLATVLPSIR